MLDYRVGLSAPVPSPYLLSLLPPLLLLLLLLLLLQLLLLLLLSSSVQAQRASASIIKGGLQATDTEC
eukprot:COSAG01_NODE_237_length_20722_cov_360.895747_22_plen_68_part_00